MRGGSSTFKSVMWGPETTDSTTKNTDPSSSSTRRGRRRRRSPDATKDAISDSKSWREAKGNSKRDGEAWDSERRRREGQVLRVASETETEILSQVKKSWTFFFLETQKKRKEKEKGGEKAERFLVFTPWKIKKFSCYLYKNYILFIYHVEVFFDGLNLFKNSFLYLY